eukprot:5809074-Lingulodinium_polyedra.AAC.1
MHCIPLALLGWQCIAPVNMPGDGVCEEGAHPWRVGLGGVGPPSASGCTASQPWVATRVAAPPTPR